MFAGKDGKYLPGGSRVRAMVAIAYKKEAFLSEPFVKMNGLFFASFIKQYFKLCFAKAGPRRGQILIFIIGSYSS